MVTCLCAAELSVFCRAACWDTMSAGSPVRALSSSAEGMQIHLDLLSAAQHPHRGIEAPWRDHHLPPAHQLPVPREEHLQDHRGRQ